MKQLQSWWKGLSRRDQRLFAAWLVGMAVVALVWFWSVLAAAQERAQSQLATELKVLGTMRVQAEELQRLKQLPPAGSNVEQVSPAAISESLTKFGMSSEIFPPQASGEQVTLQGMVPFDKWVDWLVFAQKDMRMVVQKAKVTRSDIQGMVEIQATLEPGRTAP